VIGVIVLSAGEPGFFTEALWPTLDEMAVDVSFALDNFEREAERSRALEAVRESEERFRGLVEQSLVGIVIVDRDTVVLYSNPRAAEILGCAQSEVHGQSYRQWIVDADWPLVERQLGLVMSGEVTVGKVEFTARRKDGRNVVIGGQGVRTLYKGQPALLGVMQDISEKKHAEEQIQRHVTELESAFMSTVNVAATLSEMRDPYTAGHERRVAEIAVAIGAALGLDARRQEGLRVAGYLHDVGKISIPAEILAKPGKLTKIEYQLIQAHPQAGHDVLKDVNFPWPVAQVALQHHERIDGTGYPQGLKGDQILIEARIMAVADVVEAMATHRPYRPGLGIDRALAEIERGRGSAYDTGVADACLRLFREKSYKIPE
jgi:PAS domain S-box-containing protein